MLSTVDVDISCHMRYLNNFNLIKYSEANNLNSEPMLRNNVYFRTLFWISGTSGKSIVRGSWTRDVPQTLIPSANLNEPSSLQYDVTSNR